MDPWAIGFTQATKRILQESPKKMILKNGANYQRTPRHADQRSWFQESRKDPIYPGMVNFWDSSGSFGIVWDRLGWNSDELRICVYSVGFICSVPVD